MPAPDFSIRLGLVGAATVLTGIQSVFNMAGQLVGRIRALAEAADAYGDVVSGHVVSVQAANAATQGLIESITLHQQAARMEAAGVEVTSEQLRALAVAATNYANTTGQDINESFVALTDSVTRCTSRGLRPYGVELQRGASLDQQRQAVLDQLTRSYGDQTIEINGTADAFTALENTATTAFNELLLAAERNAGPLQVILRGITGAVTDLGNALEAQRRAQEHMARMGSVVRQQELERNLIDAGYNAEGRRVRGGIEGTFASFQRLGAALNMGINPLYNMEEMDAIARAASNEIARLQQHDQTLIRLGQQNVVDDATPAYTAPPDDAGGGGGGRNPLGRLAASDIGQRGWDRMIQETVDAAAEMEAQVAQLYREQGSSLRDFWTELSESQAQHAIDFIDARIDAEEKAMERLSEAQEAHQERVIAQVEREEEARQAAIDRASGYAQTVGGIYGTLVGAIGGFAGAMAANAEEEKKIQGSVYMAEQVGALLLATTMMAISIASEQYGQAAAYAAAIVAAGIGIAKTAVEFGVSSKSGTGGGGGMHSPEHTVGRMERGYQPATVVHVNGIVTSERVNEELVALQRDSARAY